MVLPDVIVAQADDMGHADMSILSGNLAPELLEYVFQITAPRKPSGRGDEIGILRPRAAPIVFASGGSPVEEASLVATRTG